MLFSNRFFSSCFALYIPTSQWTALRSPLWNFVSKVYDNISRHDAPILNDKYFPKAAYGSMANMLEALEDGAGAGEAGLFKYPHLQLRNVSFSVQRGRREERVLDMINIEARGGELLAILATSSECLNYILSGYLIPGKFDRVYGREKGRVRIGRGVFVRK